MQLNSLKPAFGSKKKKLRVGRGMGSGVGKTCGLGHKGQRARSGGFHKVGFEGGQMPLQRRLPKLGFKSRKQLVHSEIRLTELSQIEGNVVNLESLLKADLISSTVKTAKIFASGKINKALTVSGIRVTKGARAAIEAAGGKVEG